MGGRRESRTRGQSSMEYLLITGFAFLILFAIMVIAYMQTAAFSTDVAAAQVQKVGNQIVDAANSVYYAGPPTKKTFTVYFPEHITAIDVADHTLLFTMEGNGRPYEYAISAAANMSGTLRPFNGLHTITVVADEAVVNITDG